MRIWLMGIGLALVLFVGTLARGPFIEQTVAVMEVPFGRVEARDLPGGFAGTSSLGIQTDLLDAHTGDTLFQIPGADAAADFPGTVAYFYPGPDYKRGMNNGSGILCPRPLSVLEKYVPTWVGCHPAYATRSVKERRP